ncbi:N-(5'-phosphoribosyl)anthranilate isomerase [bioreactor metagenome]|uniref:phosphoribosylanthranilate isomerase n=1 Tax=bioreactor metagenome TaxID=1076179 RepID=A0A644Z598_9ZZZZ
MTKIKICGLTRTEDIEMVNEFLPDYIGFVFAKSRRQVSAEQAKELKNKLRPAIKAVGVFVNEKPENIAEIANQGIIDLIQIHGDEDAAYCAQLRKLTQAPIIKVVRVELEDDFAGIEEFDCDYYLFDTLSSKEYGGTGKAFDHSLLHNKEIKKPFFVAGGLNQDNVAAVIEVIKPFGVDTSGGVETDGIKDVNKIKEFTKQGRIVGKND